MPSDGALELTEPANYVELLQFASPVIRRLDPGRRIVIAATQAIQQAFPTRLNYNKEMRDLGPEGLGDIWNVHLYGKNFESVAASGGVADFQTKSGFPFG